MDEREFALRSAAQEEVKTSYVPRRIESQRARVVAWNRKIGFNEEAKTRDDF
jgi:hypothetical protein